MVVLALVVACKGAKDKGKPAPAPKPAASAVVPKVSVASVLAKEEAKPPFLLVLDDAGKAQVNAFATWAEVDTKDPRMGAKTASLDMIDGFTNMVMGLGQDPVKELAEWQPDATDVDLASLEDTSARTNPSAQDDPPPPEEEDMLDDGEDESGGTGTAMVIEEGKMGKRDSDRAEGQYKMQKNQEDPQLARQQALERARREMSPGTPDLFVSPPREDGTPSRVAKVAGGIWPDSSIEGLQMMVLASPQLKATKLIDAIVQTQAAIAVSHAGKIRPLRLNFQMTHSGKPSPAYWLEVRVAANGSMVVEAVPDKPIQIAKLDELAGALDAARTARGATPDSHVDVLVDPSIDTQRLVDTLVALDLAGVRVIGMGEMPNAEETARRGKRVPTTSFGQPQSIGELDKAEIRAVMKANRAKLQACYDKALVNAPALAGTMVTTFLITGKGTVASPAATGVDPALADCVKNVIAALVFPKPKGGTVQVSYPFTFRP